MARITYKRPGGFTGHIGAVRFVKGVAETFDPEALDYFREHPAAFDVADDNEHDEHDEHDDDLGELGEDDGNQE